MTIYIQEDVVFSEEIRRMGTPPEEMKANLIQDSTFLVFGAIFLVCDFLFVVNRVSRAVFRIFLSLLLLLIHRDVAGCTSTAVQSLSL